MTKSRKLNGYRHRFIDNPVQWKTRADRRAVYHRIEAEGVVQTPDGEMVLARINHNVELARPDVDVAVLVGQAVVYRRSRVVDPQSPELWFWNDKFWVKARDGGGTPYYHDKCYLLYEVEVADPDLLMQQLNTGYNAE